jgi:hypothetical protein
MLAEQYITKLDPNIGVHQARSLIWNMTYPKSPLLSAKLQRLFIMESETGLTSNEIDFFLKKYFGDDHGN